MLFFARAFLYSTILSLFLIISGCGEQPAQTASVKAKEASTPKADLSEIIKSGVLRILTTPEMDNGGLPRNLTPRQREEALLAKLAENLKLQLVIVYVDKLEELIPALLEGKGDIIASNITITADRLKKINFTIPVAATTEQIVARSSFNRKGLICLARQTVVMSKGSSYWKNMEKLRRTRVPSLTLKAAPDGVNVEDLLHMVGTGKIKFTVSDSNFIDAFQAYRPDIKSIYEFPGQCKIAWGVRPNSPKLLKLLNMFLKKELPEHKKKSLTGDLPQIKKRKLFRVLTRNNPSCYFMHRGHMMGFEYELVHEFAKRNGLKPVMIVPPEGRNLIPWLMEGKGDIVAAAMTITNKRKKLKDVSFCHPYCEISEWLVTRKNEKSLKSLKDLAGRTIVVRKNSSYWETLEKLRDQGIKFNIIAAPDNMETYEIIANVANGKYDATLADKHIIDAEKWRAPNVKAAFEVNNSKTYGWLMRKEDKKLKNAIDSFFKKEKKSLFFNSAYNKYFKNSKMTEKHEKASADKGSFRISKYDPIIIKYSDMYSFPWLLIASQVFQESSFRAKIKAWDGGMGLMQLMPATAKELGCKNPYNPADNVNAGVKYLYRLRVRAGKKQYNGELDDLDKVSFALASYNGGYGHIIDARRLAEKLRLNPDKWNNNVEEAIKLLSRKKYASRARYGYCQSKIITNYVNNILMRYNQYALEADNGKNGKLSEKKK